MQPKLLLTALSCLLFLACTVQAQPDSLLDRKLEECSERELLELKVAAYRNIAEHVTEATKVGGFTGGVIQLAEAHANLASAEIELYRHIGDYEKLSIALKAKVEAQTNKLRAAILAYNATGASLGMREAEIQLLDALLEQKRWNEIAPNRVENPVAHNNNNNNADNNADDNMVTVQAGVGMTGKGQYGTPTYANPAEIISVPISAYFSTRERLALQQVEHAMNLFKAEQGRAPSSQEEFMTALQGVTLPRLPAGHEYLYDPADGQLKVRRPK